MTLRDRLCRSLALTALGLSLIAGCGDQGGGGGGGDVVGRTAGVPGGGASSPGGVGGAPANSNVGAVGGR